MDGGNIIEDVLHMMQTNQPENKNVELIMLNKNVELHFQLFILKYDFDVRNIFVNFGNAPRSVTHRKKTS